MRVNSSTAAFVSDCVCGFERRQAQAIISFFFPISLTLDKQQGCEYWDVWCDGILETFRHPWSLCVRMYQMFSTDKNEVFSKIYFFTIELAVCWSLPYYWAEFRERLQGKWRADLQYVYHSRVLSCFPYGDGCAATSKLSHNARLNWNVKMYPRLHHLLFCKACTLLTSPLSLTFNTAPLYLLLQCAQIT